jgi:hypothetical protein
MDTTKRELKSNNELPPIAFMYSSGPPSAQCENVMKECSLATCPDHDCVRTNLAAPKHMVS